MRKNDYRTTSIFDNEVSEHSPRPVYITFVFRKGNFDIIKNSRISGRTKKMCRAVQKISPFCSEFYNLVSHHFGFAIIFISGSSTVMSLVHGFREASSRSKHPPRQLFVKPFHSATPYHRMERPGSNTRLRAMNQ